MKVVIAGSRTIVDLSLVEKVIEESGFTVTTLISGAARGVDSLAEQWAKKNNVPILRYPALWDKYGRSAGMKRNRQMIDEADACIFVWDGESKGTRNGIDYAMSKRKPTYVHNKGRNLRRLF